MAEYIEKESLIKSFDCNGGHFVYSKQIIDAVVSRINLQPVIDAVEVVRCKDCVNFKSISNPKYCTKHIDDWGNGEIYTDEDDFCSFGERRSEE